MSRAGIVAGAGTGIDGLVLNGGVMLPGTVAEASVDDWRATLDVDRTGAANSRRRGERARRPRARPTS